MGESQTESRMEGWLYLIRSNRFGLQYSRKRYFVLEDNYLKSYKSIPTSRTEVPVKSAGISSSIRVMDNGRESIHRNVLFIFTLYNTSNHNDQIKLGASSPEEAASWIHYVQEATLKACPNSGDNVEVCPKSMWRSFRWKGSTRERQTNSVDWTLNSTKMTQITSDVIAPASWIIFGCQNGLRLFREAKDIEGQGMSWDGQPAIMAVGVVDGTSEDVFQTLLSLGPSRSEWDFCFYRGSVVEHLDGHTDIIHEQLTCCWLPWGMRQRDLLVRRYWRREDDGTYVILYDSVCHKKCPRQKGYVRASLKSGGYVISPVNQGKQSFVKHMLAIDWKFWKAYILPSSARSITIRMLGRVAALRELFKARMGNFTSDNRSVGVMKGLWFQQCKGESEQNDTTTETRSEVQKDHERELSEAASLVELHDASDEFFDVREQSDNELHEESWASDYASDTYSQGPRPPKFASATGLVKKLQELAVQKKGSDEGSSILYGQTCCYGSTLPRDPSCTTASSCSVADPSTFLIRGKTYLEDRKKMKAKSTLMQMVAADWLQSDKREDNLAGRPGGIVQKYASSGGPEFFFVVNMQVPGTTTYSLALYYMLSTPLSDSPMLESFVNGDEAHRNSRFKLIPFIPTGSWVVKQSVGKKACLVGQALEINYHQGTNYIELGVDIGSSTVARGVVSLVLGYLNNLVIEMAFVIQSNTQEELPEQLLGTCRLNHLDASKAVVVTPHFDSGTDRSSNFIH